jgi:hypothetical protein
MASMPTANKADAVAGMIASLSAASSKFGVRWGPIGTVAIPAPRFNHLLEQWRVKSGVLASAVITLLQDAIELPGDDRLEITVDKLGGRNFYAPLLNEAFPGGWVRVIQEGPLRCEYAIEGLRRPVHLVFEPRADGANLNAALASMAAKYLREVCMGQFNRYWLSKVPGLKPTAGYPVDATRFYKVIQPMMASTGIDAHAVWRSR